MVRGSDLLLRQVGLNETRSGILRVLERMGADLNLSEPREFGAEAVADVRVRYRPGLRGIDIPADWIPSLIDELPAIMALASVAEGTTRIRGAEELRVKESDRLAVMARGLAGLGVSVREYRDGIDIEGGRIDGGEVDGAGDHRCAMSFCVLGQVAEGAVTVNGASQIDTSYPEFTHHLAAVGGAIETIPAEGQKNSRD
jgi:3-phosphoshikimate 1-carboxyvinyltransferase